jgi:ectoine hydroxylase-related dioxygenase (phytanoyl-CoA dioxygenase family)
VFGRPITEEQTMSKVTDAMPDLERDLTFYPVENENPRSLTRTQIAHYNERGYIAPLEVFNEAEAAAHREYFDRLMARAQDAGWDNYAINGWQAHCPELHDLIMSPRISDYVSDLFGEDLVCWGTHYFCKLPGDLKRVSWHQDASYWPLTPSKTATVWLAIDDADEENGAMKVVPRSHVHGQIAFEQSTAEENNVLNQSVNDATRYGDEPVTVSLKAGQMSLHSDLLLHGSEPNPSSRRRCGLTMRFVPPEVRALTGWNRNALVTRGSDPTGHWPHTPRPEQERIPQRGG